MGPTWRFPHSFAHGHVNTNKKKSSLLIGIQGQICEYFSDNNIDMDYLISNICTGSRYCFWKQFAGIKFIKHAAADFTFVILIYVCLQD